MSRGYIEKRQWLGPVPLKPPTTFVEQPAGEQPTRPEPATGRHTATSGYSLQGRPASAASSSVNRPTTGLRHVGVSADGSPSGHGGHSNRTDSSTCSSSPCTGDGSVRTGAASQNHDVSSARDGTLLDYLGCRQVSVVTMDVPRTASASQTPRSTLSKATGLSLSVGDVTSPPQADKKALESTDGNWMLKSEALTKAEKAKVRTLHARNIVVSNKLSEAKKAEDKKRRSNGDDVQPADRSPVDVSASSSTRTKAAPSLQHHSLTARAFSPNHGVRVEPPQRPSILARDELGNLFLVPVLDAGCDDQRMVLSRTSSGSSPGSGPRPHNEAFVFSVNSPHSISTPDLLHGAQLTPYVAKASRQAPSGGVSTTLPRNLPEQRHRVRAPSSPQPQQQADYLYSTMPRSTGSKDGTSKNIYKGAVVRVQVPGQSGRQLQHSRSVEEQNMAGRVYHVQARGRSTGDDLEVTGKNQMRYIDAEVHIDAKTRAEGIGKDKTPTSKQQGTAKKQVRRENSPRTVRLQKGRNGFGFVLRGAKSQNQATSTLDFKPTADFPALQYLDRVDHDSVADRAGLKAGDFVLEINGENVVNATHEHTVSLIKNSGDVLEMKVVTVKPLTHEALDQRHIHADGTRTLPHKKKAPKPPPRSPLTSLSHLKKESVDDITVLDGTLTHYDIDPDRQSVGNASDSFVLNNAAASRGLDQNNKTASISRRTKRLSSTPLEGIFERQGSDDISLEHSASHQQKPVVIGAQKIYANPQEARFKQNGTFAVDASYSHHISQVDVRDGDPDSNSAGQYSDVGPSVTNVRLSTVSDHDRIYQAEHSSDGIYSVPYKHHQQGAISVKISDNRPRDRTPPRPMRAPPQTPLLSGGRNVIIPPPPTHAPPTTPHSTELGQVIPIQTNQHQYANVSEQIQRQRSGTDSDSSFESSFRPGSKAYVAKDPLGGTPPAANHSRQSSGTSSLSSSTTSNHGEYQLSNGTSGRSPHLTSADVHHSTPAKIPEPEPDYDDRKEEPSKLPSGDIPSLRSLREVNSAKASDTSSVSSAEKASAPVRHVETSQPSSGTSPPQLVASRAPQKTTSQSTTKSPAPMPPTSQPKSLPPTPPGRQEETVMSAFGNAIKMAALAREKRAQEAEKTKSKAPAPSPPTSSAASIPPPPPGAPPAPPIAVPPSQGIPPTSVSKSSPAVEKKPVPAHIQRQLEETRKREESHAALLAAVAKRRNIVESADRENLADTIESRIQRAKKLQTVVYKSDQSKPEVKTSTPPAAPVLAKPPERSAEEKDDTDGKETSSDRISQTNNNNDLNAKAEVKPSSGQEPVTQTNSDTDFLAAAEKARQQYLQKKQQATLERKTPTKSPASGATSDNSTDSKDSPTSTKTAPKTSPGEPKTQPTLSDVAHLIAQKALEKQRNAGAAVENHNNNNAAAACSGDTSSNSSLTLSSDGSVNAVEVHGATTDASHTDTPQSSRTPSFSSAANDDVALLPVSARKRIFEANQSRKVNAASRDYHNLNGGPVKFATKGQAPNRPIQNGVAHKEAALAGDPNVDFIPPPPLFDGDNVTSAHEYSISSMSTPSSVDRNHDDGQYAFDVLPPPPPPGFDDSPKTSTTDLADGDADFIPPPAEFDSPSSPVSLKNVQRSIQSHSVSYPAVRSAPAGGKPSFQDKPIDRWTSADVGAWLDSLQLGEHRDRFLRSNVTGQQLTRIDRNRLIALGVDQVGHRMAIERAIKKAMIQ